MKKSSRQVTSSTSPRFGRRSWGQILLVALGAVAIGGCYSPTLPLPPPSRPEISVPDDNGTIHIRGTVPGGSEVFAKNQRSLKIVGEQTDASGVYDLVMAAEPNDRIIVWYVDRGDQSDFVEAWVPGLGIGAGGAGGADGM